VAENQDITQEKYVIGQDKNIEDLLPLEHTVELSVKYGLFAGSWRSKVLSYEGDTIKIASPSDKSGNKVRIWPGVKTYIVFFREGEGMFEFPTEILAENEIVGTLDIKVPAEVLRIQRRRYKRVQTPGVKAFLKVVRDDEEDDEYKEGEVLDISGGGMKLRLSEKYEVGTVFDLKFSLENDYFDGIKGEVVWNSEIEVGGSKKYLHGINFIEITPRDRQKIIKYVMRKEAEELAKKKEMEG